MGHRSRRCSSGAGSHDVAAQAFGQAAGVEIQDQADADAAHAQILVQSRFMGRQDGRNSLDLKNRLARDNDVHPEAIADRYALGDDRDRNLTLAWYARLPQFMAQALLVDQFEQSPPRVAMDLDRQPDHLFREFLRNQHHHQLLWPTVALRPFSVIKYKET